MKTVLWMALALAIAASVGGCALGMAPRGPDAAEVKKELNELPPQKQIQYWQTSPAPANVKAEKIKEIEDKYHVTADQAPANPGRPGG